MTSLKPGRGPRGGRVGQTSLRLHMTALERADALVPKMQDRAKGNYPTMNRSDVIRMAIEIGLEHLEHEPEPFFP